MTNNISDPDGTRRARRLLEMGYSTREVEEEQNNPTGSYFANALAFIVESLNDDHFLRDIENLDIDTMMEFADMYNFTTESLHLAIDAFRKSAFREVTGTR